VDGILTADPSIIPTAKLLEIMTFDEASELAYFGARVLYPAAIQPALKNGIPVRVLNSHFPKSEGTLIVDKLEKSDNRIVKSIAYKEGITLLTLTSSQLLLSTKLLAKFLGYLNDFGLPVYAISKSATKLSLTLETNKDISTIVENFNTFGETHVENNKAIVSIVGEKMRGNPDISWQVIKLLKEKNITVDLISQFSSQISFMFIIDEKDIETTVKLIHEKYI
jgi:aspartate kinase